VGDVRGPAIVLSRRAVCPRIRGRVARLAERSWQDRYAPDTAAGLAGFCAASGKQLLLAGKLRPIRMSVSPTSRRKLKTGAPRKRPERGLMIPAARHGSNGEIRHANLPPKNVASNRRWRSQSSTRGTARRRNLERKRMAFNLWIMLRADAADQNSAVSAGGGDELEGRRKPDKANVTLNWMALLSVWVRP